MQWLCRRGSLELDIILSRYLEYRYDNAPVDEQQLFERLLSFPDTELQRIFINQKDPIDAGILDLVRIIRSIAPNNA